MVVESKAESSAATLMDQRRPFGDDFQACGKPKRPGRRLPVFGRGLLLVRVPKSGVL
jgi:hypothetical protein